MRFRDDQGQMLVLTALCMTMLMGFLALAIDVGMLFRAKRNVQIAADAGAIAGALQEKYGDTPRPRCRGEVSRVRCAVQNAVAANGFPAIDVVSVSANPTNGYHTGPGYVETIVSVPNPTYFLSAFRGIGTPLKVTARAVAGMAPSTTCIYVLDPADADSLTVQAPISARDCGIQVNSNSPEASCDQGATIAVPFLHITGGQDSGTGCQATNSTQVVTGVAPAGDPLNGLPVINTASVCTLLNTIAIGGKNPIVTAATRIPSTILRLGGISVAVTCFSDLNVVLSALTLGTAGANQLFIFESGVQIVGNVTINGTLYIAQGTLAQQAGQLSINAPTDPTDLLNGIGIFQPSTNTTPCSPTIKTPCLQILLVAGSVNGIIYAPTARVSIQGEGGVDGIVAYQLDVSGPLSLTRNYNLANPTTSPLNKVELVE